MVSVGQILTLPDVHFQRFEATTAIPDLVSRASGLVIDLGPALGNQLQNFDLDKVTQVYGIDKNPFFVAELEVRLRDSAVRDKYAVIACGIEDTDVMEAHGIADGGVDTVLCIQVLCSVSDPEAVARRLYKLLRPGGRLIFWEHHGNHDGVTKIVQRLWNPFWRFGWDNFESVQGDEQPWSMMPRVWGELAKKE
ncbi:hypothetical protein LQW54_005867 [Pestalotiopsis sp. IQ-011]